MRSATAILSALVVAIVCISGSYAQQGIFNVTKPTPNSPYVAGQKLPLVYDVASTTTEQTLQLSVTLIDPRNATNNVLMVQNGDISQGFSNQKEIGNTTVYEHQTNYDIPTNTAAGEYQVVYTNTITGYNTTIPITIAEAGTTPSPASPSSTDGSNDDETSMWDTGAASSISLAPVWFTLLAVVGMALNM
ncbi:hypothetical protein BDB00DRAFT_757322 [Zychaea mexicana]|uniref:uncharacterized protein n=1 Tax=Zychaea mexicana TaxID=64656 RepID=UPI0022FDB134|nr:uncharacterized protein BDB00DRAFT_757322 [Zychaea mexicana]KAI9497039.1 hypothetical protein BDB00DRAFT_757322 [Zychaea mexicana]